LTHSLQMSGIFIRRVIKELLKSKKGGVVVMSRCREGNLRKGGKRRSLLSRVRCRLVTLVEQGRRKYLLSFWDGHDRSLDSKYERFIWEEGKWEEI